MRNPKGLSKQYANIYVPSRRLTDASGARSLKVQCNILRSFCDGGGYGYSGYLAKRYGAGVPLAELTAALAEELPHLNEACRFVRENAEDYAGYHPLYGHDRSQYALIALALLTSDDTGIAEFSTLIAPCDGYRAYLFDVIAKAFIPQHTMCGKHKVDKYAAPWSGPILTVLAQPAQHRAAGLAAHLKNWCRLMRPFNWTPNPKVTDLLYFNDFAFEVALVACAYDIDDSDLRAHPYFPSDLVDYYRNHRRHSRDAWRPHGAGAGIAVIAPPPLPKADLATSKRKNIARWVELVCDGDTEATAAVLEQIGKPRKIKDLDALLCALDENGQAIQADLKDDDTLSIQCGQLAYPRGMGDYEAPPGPPHGTARCRATLRAFAALAQLHGYRLVDLDSDDDAWLAVMVRAGYQPEFQALSEALGLRTRAPADGYDDCVTSAQNL